MPDMFTEISYSLRDHVATIRMERPERLNGWSATMSTEIVRALTEAKADDDVRVAILTGSGKAYCAGGDATTIVDRFIDDQAAPTWSVEVAMGHVPNVLPTLRGFDKPVIAAVNGIAAGAGFASTLMSDIRIAGASARFVNVYMRRGTVPSMAPYYLPWIVGLSQACRLILADKMIDAAEAHRIGLVGKLVSDEDLPEAAHDLAVRIAANPLPALRRAKRCLMHAREVSYATSRELGLMANLGVVAEQRARVS
jgi:2-(1,2-epoxy-1,2-dihydrophenyl)acetyl-CoA isomerase